MKIIEVDYDWNGSLPWGNDPAAIIWHHAEISECSCQDIHSWHVGRGWVGIGYHFFIKKDGSVFRGRPEKAMGSHCPGFNSRSIGICFEGALDRECLTEEQKNSGLELARDLISRYPITKSYGHGEVYPTDCPGSNFPLNEMRSGTFDISVIPTKPSTPSERTWLQVGDSGSKVQELQDKLSRLGYNVGNADGIYGKDTKGAVYNFQQDLNLCADGLAGTETLKAIDAKLSNSYVSENDTLKLQNVINRLNIASIAKDGIEGPATSEATRILQLVVGVTTDGIAGSSTWSAINYILEKPLCGLPYVTPIPTRYIQWRLGLDVDGIFGPNTSLAVSDWQREHGISADGIVGSNTWTILIG